MNFLLKKTTHCFATLALAEHNGKVLSKNTLKLLSAAQKLKDEVVHPPLRLICSSWDPVRTPSSTASSSTQART
jgi:hypothetical protein